MTFVALLLASQVAFFGDSLVEDRANEGTETWVTKLCTLMQGDATCAVTGTKLDSGGTGQLSYAPKVGVKNLGDTGDEVCVEIKNRYVNHVLKGPGQPFRAVVMEGGHNDFKLGRTSAAVYACMQPMLDNLLERGIDVVVIYGWPEVGSSGWTGGMETESRAYDALLVTWCGTKSGSRVKCVDAGEILDADDDGDCDATFCTDAVHLDAPGGTVLAPYMFQEAKDVLNP